MITTGVFKILKIERSAYTSNKTKYVHCLAVDFFNQGDKEAGIKGQFVMLKAFGSNAEFLEKNAVGIRRVYVSGELSVDTYKEKIELSDKISFNGVSGTVKIPGEVEKQSLSITVHSARFLDKPNESATGATFIADESGSGSTFVPDEAGESSVPNSENFVVETTGKPVQDIEDDEVPAPKSRKRVSV